MEKQAYSVVMLDGITFHLGDNVETIKGANYWGEIIAFDTDDALPGCTVLATDPGFAGTKHVYPLKQLQHRRKMVRPLEEWHEDYGYAVWWTWRDGQWLGEPSYIGSPLCDDWPGYHTHWTPHPAFPANLTTEVKP